MSNKLDQLKTLAEKKQMLSFFDNLRIDTFVISYLGQLNFGDAARYVESVHLYSSGNHGLILNMLSAGEHITIDVLQSFASELFFEEFVRTLQSYGLDHTATGKIAFATTPDKASVPAGRQAKKYYLPFEN
ncbi:hypothetical protein B0I08_10494 [Glaciihabitans tibetensis]|uniref:Uncharacterized protein n=1 Tax=Glaciihabitans tibetensis TaxID=1266600 RepID=A0A2T0VE28_9MICO|nr:hypothetical protein [Glaciihabitans tibetensis]PRY68392.1 hypothetical protein B0I08_10494 [Glaciihabitans tibetensis]